jgi:hypothetical protein
VSICSITDVRAHLRMPASYTADDYMLANIFMPAADEVIKTECNEVIFTQYDEYYDGGDLSIWLRHFPIISVETVEEGWGYTNYTLSYVQVNTILSSESQLDPQFCYSIDTPETGEISRRVGGNVNIPFVQGESNVHVVYTAGRDPIPGNLYLAELELVAHWYQNSMQRAGSAGNAAGYDAVNVDFPHSGADITTTLNQGVPYRVLELIKGTRRSPIIG